MEIIMPGELTRFIIEALHDRYTIDVPIEDNKLILVGENGTSKSTVANIIYLFLTQQWYRIPITYDFKSITAVIDAEEIEITKEELVQSGAPDLFLRKVSISTRQRFSTLFS